jgi:hypothetical protein
MAGLLSYDDNEDEIDPRTYGLLGASRNGPDLGMLSLAAGLLEPVPNGKFSTALANGLKGWAGGAVAQRKLEEADAENDPNALMRKYMMQARIKAQMAKEYPEAEKWGMAPFVDKTGKVYQFSSGGQIRELPDMNGRFAPTQSVDLGGSVGTFNPNSGVVSGAQQKTPPPAWSAEHPGNSRYETIDLGNGATGQRDNLTGQISAIPQPEKAPQMPGNLVEATANNDNLIKTIDEALGTLEKNPKAVGLQNAIPFSEKTQQYLDPNGVDVRAQIGRIGSQKIHDISGAAVTINEAKRFADWVPSTSDTPDALKTKLKFIRDEANNVNKQIRNNYQGPTPVRGTFGNTTVDISNIDDAKAAYAQMPMGSKGKDELGQAIVAAETGKPFSVNSSSVAPLRKPTQQEIASAREAIRLGHRDEVLKRFQSANVDPEGL